MKKKRLLIDDEMLFSLGLKTLLEQNYNRYEAIMRVVELGYFDQMSK